MNKRGTAAVLAMIFLVIFAALSSAFYVMVDMSVAVGRNDRNGARSRAAAESGMEYVKHSLAMIKLKGSLPNTAVIDTMYTQFGEKFRTSHDVASGDVDYLDLKEILLPVVNLDPLNAQRFTGSVKSLDVVNGAMNLLVKVEGQDTRSKLRRNIYAEFRSVPAGRNIFEFDVASAGVIKVENATLTGSGDLGRANVMSASEATPSIYIENSTISGGLAVVLSEDQLDASARGKISVNGVTDASAIMDGVNLTDPPTIPDFTPNDFKNFVNLVPIDASQLKDSNVYTNRILSGNARTSSKFPSGSVINGILFIEPPNHVEFLGSVTLNGIIVFGQGLRPDGTPYGPNDCSISMSGNYSFTQNISAIPTDPPDLAAKLQGYTILAPSAKVEVGGSTQLKAEGSIVCYSFTATNSGVRININNGTLLTLSPDNPSIDMEQGTITFTRTHPIDPPDTGVSYYRHYVMIPDSYEEVLK